MTGLCACLPDVQHRCNPEEGCAICLFTLSPFTEAENFEYICLPVSVPVGIFSRKKGASRLPLSFIPSVPLPL